MHTLTYTLARPRLNPTAHLPSHLSFLLLYTCTNPFHAFFSFSLCVRVCVHVSERVSVVWEQMIEIKGFIQNKTINKTHKLRRSQLHLLSVSLLQLFHLSPTSVMLQPCCWTFRKEQNGVSLPPASFFFQCWPLDIREHLGCVNCSLYFSTQTQRELRQH